MRILKANTAVRLVVGPLCDKTTGLAKTGMTVTNMAMNMWHEHDDGSAPTKSIDAVSFTASGGSNDMVELAGGYYDIEVTAAQLNITAGRCGFCIYDDDVILPYFEEWLVVPANVFDSIMGTDKLDVNAAELGGTTQTGNDVGADVNDILADTGTDGVLVSSGTAAKQISLDAGKVLLQATQTGVTIPTVTTVTNAPTGMALEATLTAIKGAGWGATHTLVNIVDWLTGTTENGTITLGNITQALDEIKGTGWTNENLKTMDALIDAIKAKTDNLPSDPADDSDLDTSIAAVKTVVDAVKLKTDNIPASPAAVGSAMTLANDAITAAVIATDAIDADAIKADAVTKLQTGITASVDATSIRSAIGMASADLDTQLDTLAGLVSSTGTGDKSWTYTVAESDGTPIPDVTVWVTSDIAGTTVLAQGTTNASGQVTFLLNDGATVYVWAKKFGWTFTNPDSEIVS